MDLQVRVADIQGHCPVYKEGDMFTLKSGYILDTEHSCPVCMHSLSSLMPFYSALSRGIDAFDLGLAPEEGKPARIRCPDPCAYTGGGTVILEIISL